MDDPLKMPHNLPAHIDDFGIVVENPEAMLRDSIWKLDCEIVSIASQAAKELTREIMLFRTILETQQEVDRWQGWLARAVQAGDDSLARKALARKQECKDSLVLLQDQLLAAQNASTRLRQQIEALKAEKEVTRSKLAILGPRMQS